MTKDQLNTGLTGQIRYRVSERNLYAYLFGVKNPLAHVMGLLHLGAARAHRQLRGAGRDRGERRGRESMRPQTARWSGISINDLRKNLRDLNDHMLQECRTSADRYGIELDASLITGIDPPAEVESALAAINTAQNLVSSDISLAQADADQKLVQSRRAVEIETLQAQAEVEALAPNTTTRFDGSNILTDASLGLSVPPDTILAVSPTKVLQGTNTAFMLTNRTGGKAQTINLNNFFNQKGSVFVFDPKVVYDRLSGRFFVVAISQSDVPQSSFIYIAVSRSGSPAGYGDRDWCKYKFNGDVRGPGRTSPAWE